MRLRPLLAVFLMVATVVLFVSTVTGTYGRIGSAFPGYLSFSNGIVGPYYLPDWSGPREGFGYHDLTVPDRETGEVFSQRDFLLVAFLPAATGLLFAALGLLAAVLFPAGGIPLLLFHVLVGNYLILSPDFQITHRLPYLFLLLFSFIPAAMLHFAFLFPEETPRRRFFYVIPYLMSAVVALPYLFLFERHPESWMKVEVVVVGYVVATYLFWIGRLVWALRHPHLGLNRIVARYLLLGQVIAFIVPLAAAIAIFVGKIPFPLNLATPLTLLFPAALFWGVLVGRLRQSQMRLVQTERMATLGNLLAGLAHELKNPLTFVYSNIEPLRERIDCLKKGEKVAGEMIDDLEGIARDIEEGAVRARGIVDNFRYFAYPGRGPAEEIDLNDILDHAIRLLTPKWKERVVIERSFGEIPKLRGSAGEIGQVFVNLIANACEAVPVQGSVRVGTELRDGRLCVSVKDTGHGIGPDRLSRIFDPFYTTKPQGEGTGLGLAIVQQIVKGHGGSIEVKSEEGQGAEFVVTLPTQPPN